MFCTSCGKEIADNSTKCPECGALVNASSKAVTTESAEAPKAAKAPKKTKAAKAAEAATEAPKAEAADAGATASAEAPKAPKAPSKYDTNVGGFLADFVKSPVKSVLSRTKDPYWLWGLISLGAILFIFFFRYGLTKYLGFGYGFKYIFSLALGFTALIFAIFLLQGAFHLKKKSLPSVVAAVGLSFAPMIPLMIVSIIFDAIGLPGSPFLNVAYIVSAVIVYSFLLDSEEESSAKSFWLTTIGYAALYFILSIFLRVIAL
ncbi:MAG: zinc ribbon domain-containing protein [Clostridiales bacterium]|nr:zinc ribbon domain-containing protein [Clostridiales bacterium]